MLSNNISFKKIESYAFFGAFIGTIVGAEIALLYKDSICNIYSQTIPNASHNSEFIPVCQATIFYERSFRYGVIGTICGIICSIAEKILNDKGLLYTTEDRLVMLTHIPTPNAYFFKEALLATLKPWKNYIDKVYPNSGPASLPKKLVRAPNR